MINGDAVWWNARKNLDLEGREGEDRNRLLRTTSAQRFGQRCRRPRGGKMDVVFAVNNGPGMVFFEEVM